MNNLRVLNKHDGSIPTAPTNFLLDNKGNARAAGMVIAAFFVQTVREMSVFCSLKFSLTHRVSTG